LCPLDADRTFMGAEVWTPPSRMGSLVEGQGLIFPKSSPTAARMESGVPLKLQTTASASGVVP